MLSALKWGALFGVLIYLVAGLGLPALAQVLFPGASLSNLGIEAFSCLGIFLVLFGFSVAGFFTGSETLRAGFGAVAGGLSMVAYAVLSTLYNPFNSTRGSTTPSAPQISPALRVAASVVAFLLVFGLAALMGWLGGRPGAQAARKRRAAAGTPITSGDETA